MSETQRHELIQLIDRVGLTHYGKSIKKHPELLAWIMEETKDLPEISFPERVYIALHGRDQMICQYECHKVFNTLNKGYRFCAPDCRCRREEQARKISAHVGQLSEEEKARREQARVNTMIERHGVINPMHIQSSKSKIKQTNLERYDCEHPSQSEQIKTKTKETNIARYGMHPTQTEDVKEKARQTNLEKYGVETTTHIARAAFAEQNGVANPFSLPEIQEKAKETMLHKHGVEKPLESPIIRSRMEERNRNVRGFSNVMQDKSVAEKLKRSFEEKYGRASFNQAHFSEETYAILQNKDRFESMFDGLSLREVAMILGVSYDTARKYCYRYGIELPKSSYEVAIAEFLRQHGFEVTTNDRRLIAPNEIDIIIPSHCVGIEFCGIYWHSDVHKPDSRYHLNKLEQANQNSYRLITIFEDEWITQREIVESRLLHILGRGERGVGARKLKIRQASSSEAKDFLDQYHLQGAGPYGFARYAATLNDQILAMMTFSHGRLGVGKMNGDIELLRFATNGRSYAGVASRLFQMFIAEHKPDRVISYADRRWSNGGLYETLGFQKEGFTEPNYWYVHPSRIRREHRFKYRKDKIINLVENGGEKTEREIMIELGYNRIWDCGSFKYVWRAL